MCPEVLAILGPTLADRSPRHAARLYEIEVSNFSAFPVAAHKGQGSLSRMWILASEGLPTLQNLNFR
ncbi:hypothetical protein MCOR07_010592 [Pyricularia oryzae]|uniref:Uncharacterized protein n=1 Tax=Pyricularia oryzae TaxID=318829 RepID=A0A4P7NFW8_PYROR|nr:hypothetical protein MCOR01_004763 [Pyricularia oryzae]KAI6315036.1 hypothetical protein MCOR34_004785 [Pyricularia oryzae]KAI6378048.1 hypothetical protein MCOR31_000901 [Pyricularia oryzae]KAI6388455.1 hypothetical protein MCOR32_000342 [Pyricularia oryzae]KAI6444347.1 hypothetical protein MCOR15_010992 [Pyricularia oryzae]